MNRLTPLKKIGVGSFNGSRKRKILFDDCIDVIPYKVFEYSLFLEMYKLPMNLKIIEPLAIREIKEHSNANFLEPLEYIMHDAFSTSNPYNITIGLEVKYIAENALLIRKTKN